MKSQSSFTRPLLDLLSSMRFAVSLLSILGIASVIGTVLKQNEPYENYIVKFGQFWFELFERLGLFDVYHTGWFLLILLFLIISTSLCVYRNTPAMLKEWRSFKDQATEKSLKAFSHQHSYQVSGDFASTQQRLTQFLTARGFQYRLKTQADGAELIAAKAGTHQRWGYILTHVAMVVILLGGLLDGNLPFKVQELLGQKRIEVLDIPVSQVPEVSRLSVNNPSFRANMTLPEGASGRYGFVRMRDGYLVQALPFTIALKDFRIEHYATGQPKSFESDIVIFDPDLKAPLAKTISVNHPLVHKGIAIYQSDFQDGGSVLSFKVWDLFKVQAAAKPLHGVVFETGALGEATQAYKVEYDEFRKFNIINLSPDGKGKPHNVGPSVTYKLRNNQGQAIEYTSYMQPLQIDGKRYFVSGMRETVQEDFRYLRIPADQDLSIEGFMRFRAILLDASQYPTLARKIAASALDAKQPAEVVSKFEQSVTQLLSLFAQGGYTQVATMIEKSVPEKERENAAKTYIKMINVAAFEAYNLGLAQAKQPLLVNNAQTQTLINESLNAFSDMFFYGTPYYLQLESYQHKEASGLQLTKSPGQKWVYLGSVLLVLGIFAMMYIRERRIWLLLKPETKEVLFAMSSNRKNLDFEHEFKQYREQLMQVLA